ncbi:MAG: hypothetical protein PHX43_08660 [Alphaproteobacteria bacterium]|nr:hypothetical protein [Alphaproteobacteria bacterium]
MKLYQKLLLASVLTLPLLAAGASYASPQTGKHLNEGVPEIHIGGDECPCQECQRHGMMRNGMHDKADLKISREDQVAFETMARLQSEIQGLLAAPKFDRKAFISKNAEIQGIRMMMEQRRVAAFAAEIEKKPVAERRTLFPAAFNNPMMFQPGPAPAVAGRPAVAPCNDCVRPHQGKHTNRVGIKIDAPRPLPQR